MGKQRETSPKEENCTSLLCPEPMTQNDFNIIESSNEDSNSNNFSSSCRRTRIAQDGCWACVSLVASAIVQFIVMGIHNSFGNMYTQILNEFNWTESTSGIGIV